MNFLNTLFQNKKKSTKLGIVFLLYCIIPFTAAGQMLNCSDCDVVIDHQKYAADGNDYDYQPGDTIGFDASADYGTISLSNWHGEKGNPITFINCNGKVEFGPTSNIGVKIKDMSYFRITGTGDSAHEYGIYLHDIDATGIQIRYGVTHDWEMDHIETANTGLGWHVVNPFNCNDPINWKEGFIMRNVSIHDCYTHHSDGEGFYIGYSNNKTITCDGDVKEPFKIRNIKFYNNKTYHTGWDGFQIGNADSAVYVWNNIVEAYGLEQVGIQDDGIVINMNTTGEWFNNTVIGTTGTGSGISVLGFKAKLYNNVVINPVENGIFIGDRSPDSLLWGENFNYQIYNNTIINPEGNGILFNSTNTTGNEIANNIIVQAEENYISERSGASYSTSNNLFDTSVSAQKFVDPSNNDFHLTNNSPAVNAGTNLAGEVPFDADSLFRPQGEAYDIGAYEFDEGTILYSLTIVNGSGDGEYPEREKVTISADTTLTDSSFSTWSGDTAFVDDPTANTAIITMPAEDITVMALYKPDSNPDTQAPSIPSGLSASHITQTTVDLQWNAASDNIGVTGYNIYQDGSLVTTVTDTSASISGLSPAIEYEFKIKAKDAAGNVSGFSNGITVTTLAVGMTSYNTAASIVLYPNPASETVTVQLPDEHFNKLELFNNLGNTVKAIPVKADDHTLSFSVTDLPHGIYTVKLTSKTQYIIARLIVVK